MIDASQISTQTFIKQVVWHAQTGSTNSDAAILARTQTVFPVLIGADEQVQGRGRKHRQWWSGPGALTFSILFQPDAFGITVAQWPLLSLTTGLAVCRTMELLVPGVQIQLKWPNDVFANHRKISGILLETIPDQSDLLIVGIGMNINNSLQSAPVELQRLATSLTDLAEQTFTLDDLLVQFLQMYAEELQALGDRDSELIERCRDRCLLNGRVLSLRDVNREVTGMCQGIDDDGAIRLLSETGPQRFFSGEISSIEGILRNESP